MPKTWIPLSDVTLPPGDYIVRRVSSVQRGPNGLVTKMVSSSFKAHFDGQCWNAPVKPDEYYGEKPA